MEDRDRMYSMEGDIEVLREEEEIWRDLKVLVKRAGSVEDYSGIYEVSSGGRIRDNEGRIVPEKTSYKYKPYKAVFLIDRSGKRKERLVHRIVATSFEDICGSYDEVVNHLDEDKSNNSAINLRWTTNRENLAWGTAKERAVRNRMERLGKRKMIEKINYSELLVSI